MKKILKIALYAVLALFLVYNYGLPVFWDGCRALISEHFPQSGYYEFVATNSLDEDLIIDTYNINDLPFRAESRHEQLQRAQFKQLTRLGVIIQPGESKTISLPSMVNFTMGILLVVARTDIRRGREFIPVQRMGIFFLYPEDTIPKLRPEGNPIVLNIDSTNTSFVEDGLACVGENIQRVELHRIRRTDNGDSSS